MCVCVCVRALTEQDDDAEQDGHQCPGAKPRPGRQRLSVAQLHVALAVAGADAHGERARAAVTGRVPVADDHRHLVDAAVQAAVAVAAGQNPGRVVCRDEAAMESVSPTARLCVTVCCCVSVAPLLSRTEKLAFPDASGARLKEKRCPPIGSSGSVALTVWILCRETAR